MPRLTLVPLPGHPAHGDEVVLEVAVGVNVLDAASAHGLLIPTRCGGVTACRTCQIVVEAQPGFSDIAEEERAALEDEGAPAGRRLACQTLVRGDATAHLLDPRECE